MITPAGAGPLGHVAIVHEDPERAEDLARVLRTAGHRVTVVVPGRRIVQSVVDCSPDLLVASHSLTDPPMASVVKGVRQDARKYIDVKEGEEVLRVRGGEKFELMTVFCRYTCRGLILSTGGYHRKLDVAGEESMAVKGVSYCATCDGFFYKGKSVVVVGGGNTALTDALYLNSIGCKVTIIHRRNAFRADKHLQESIAKQRIPVMFDTVVDEIIEGEAVASVRLRDLKTGVLSIKPTDGVFIAVGEVPSSQLASELGLEMDQGGFIVVDKSFRTNVPFVYRWRIRAGAFVNLQAIEKMAVGQLIPDVTAIIGSLDPVMAEVDR